MFIGINVEVAGMMAIPDQVQGDHRKLLSQPCGSMGPDGDAPGETTRSLPTSPPVLLRPHLGYLAEVVPRRSQRRQHPMAASIL
jgi:hypothetical protein